MSKKIPSTRIATAYTVDLKEVAQRPVSQCKRYSMQGAADHKAADALHAEHGTQVHYVIVRETERHYTAAVFTFPRGYSYYVEHDQSDDRTFLTVPLVTREDVLTFIRRLVIKGMDFHFDDDPADIINGRTQQPLFTVEELPHVRARVDEMTLKHKDPFEPLVDFTNNFSGNTETERD